jgi:hypothetical protein
MPDKNMTLLKHGQHPFIFQQWTLHASWNRRCDSCGMVYMLTYWHVNMIEGGLGQCKFCEVLL